METDRIASPSSTGGAGTFFEQHVGAYWLAHLLLATPPPIFVDTTVAKVQFQTERLGWKTDDFLVTCEARDSERKLVGQVKRTFTLSAANEDAKGAIQDFWKDFLNPELFNDQLDRFLLVTLRGTNTLLEHFVSLLDCAKASATSADFLARTAKEGYIAAKAAQYLREVRAIVGEVTADATDEQIWKFLRTINFLSLDLNTTTRQSEGFVRSLLALAVKDGNALASAESTWNSLLALATTAIPEARDVARSDLPGSLLEKHEPIQTRAKSIVAALRDHSRPVLRNIRGTIGPKLHLARGALVQRLLELLESSQIVLVQGSAGSGKSVIAKAALDHLSQDGFGFAFRAEEFAQPHLDTTLSSGMIPANATVLAAVLGAQGRNVILVDSVERLLEKSTRDALSDLLGMCKSDSGLRIILTCRDYSAEQVWNSFLSPWGIDCARLSIPPLDDDELATVQAEFPALEFALKTPALKAILRNPFLLDKSLQLSWNSGPQVPTDERSLRRAIWKQIVRAEPSTPSHEGRNRETTMSLIAVRRARALTPFVSSDDIDPRVIAALVRDSLLTVSDDSPGLVAPAHDVLEDWAILQWLEEIRAASFGSFEGLRDAVGAHPAVRRSFRKWVGELVERDASAADKLFLAALAMVNGGSQFRDDTIVSVLRAPAAPAFLQRHAEQLLSDEASLLRRLIHLLRVACVTSPDWSPPGFRRGSILNVPIGRAWPAVLSLVSGNLGLFGQAETPLLIGLIEDAVRGVSWYAPKLEGEKDVVAIAHHLSMRLSGYRHDDQRSRLVKILAKLPAVDPEGFRAALFGVDEDGDLDNLAEELRSLVLSSVEGMPFARDLPKLFVEIAEAELVLTDKDIDPDDFYGHRADINEHFGVRPDNRMHFFPASALRGPWYALLRNHPRIGIEFYLKIFNHCSDWYSNPRLPDPLEPTWGTKITFEDGAARTIACNARLWSAYRGTSVTPCVLQSMLMALENWLLEYAKTYASTLDSILLELLKRSDSVMIPGVVASVAIAHPEHAVGSLLSLLSSRDLVRLDRARLVSENHAGALNSMMAGTRPENSIHISERNASNALQHRREDLESAVTRLQFGPSSSRVHEALDAHSSALPPIAEQDEEDRLWRLAIHRMDARKFVVSEVETENGSFVKFESGELDPDIQEMVKESQSDWVQTSARMSLLMWGVKALEGDASIDASAWKEKLSLAMASDSNQQDDGMGTIGGPGLIAAVCLRDHYSDLQPSEKDWCVERVVSELKKSDAWGSDATIQRNPMAADRAAASVLPNLLEAEVPQHLIPNVREAIAIAVTHPVEEVRWRLTHAVGKSAWQGSRQLAQRCVAAISNEARRLEEAWEEQRSKETRTRRPRDLAPEIAAVVRQEFWRDPVDVLAYERLDVAEGFGKRANLRVLTILSKNPGSPEAIAAFKRSAAALVEFWNSDGSRDFHSESDLSTLLQEFAMQSAPEVALEFLNPLVKAVEAHPRELQAFVQGLTVIEDARPNTPQFWVLWQQFADASKHAKWVKYLHHDRPTGSDLLGAIFLTSYWKQNIRHWRSLEGEAHRIHSLFEALPASAAVLECFLRFLYHIGERSLPDAFVLISKKLAEGEPSSMLAHSESVFLLEVLLERQVYGRPLALKQTAQLREAVLNLLDLLVEQGSSSAFKMRDDFVTPMPQ